MSKQVLQGATMDGRKNYSLCTYVLIYTWIYIMYNKKRVKYRQIFSKKASYKSGWYWFYLPEKCGTFLGTVWLTQTKVFLALFSVPDSKNRKKNLSPLFVTSCFLMFNCFWHFYQCLYQILIKKINELFSIISLYRGWLWKIRVFDKLFL